MRINRFISHTSRQRRDSSCTISLWLAIRAHQSRTPCNFLIARLCLTKLVLFIVSLAFAPTAPKEESSSSDDPLFSEPIAPTLSLGERVAWVKSSGPEFGVVKWIGRMPQISNDWTVGVEFVSHDQGDKLYRLIDCFSLFAQDNAIGSGDGTVEGRRYFVAKDNFAKFLPLSDLTKVDNYAGRPRSGRKSLPLHFWSIVVLDKRNYQIKSRPICIRKGCKVSEKCSGNIVAFCLLAKDAK